MSDLDDFIRWTNGLRVRPVMVMHDDFKMSVQASEYHYSIPQKDNLEDYEAFEIGFPSEYEPLLKPYESDEGIYSYVPKRIVEQIIEKHDGISFDESVEGFVIGEKELNEAITLASKILDKLKEIEEVGEMKETTDGIRVIPFYIPFHLGYPLFEYGWAYPDDPPAPLIQKILKNIKKIYVAYYDHKYLDGNKELSGIPVIVSARKTTGYSNDLEDAQNNLYDDETGSSYVSEIPAIEHVIDYSYELLSVLKKILESMENADWFDSDFRWYQTGEVDEGRTITVPAVFVGYIGDDEWDFYITDEDFISGSIQDFIARNGSGYEIKNKFGNADEYYVKKVGD